MTGEEIPDAIGYDASVSQKKHFFEQKVKAVVGTDNAAAVKSLRQVVLAQKTLSKMKSLKFKRAGAAAAAASPSTASDVTSPGSTTTEMPMSPNAEEAAEYASSIPASPIANLALHSPEKEEKVEEPAVVEELPVPAPIVIEAVPEPVVAPIKEAEVKKIPPKYFAENPLRRMNSMQKMNSGDLSPKDDSSVNSKPLTPRMNSGKTRKSSGGNNDDSSVNSKPLTPRNNSVKRTENNVHQQIPFQSSPPPAQSPPPQYYQQGQRAMVPNRLPASASNEDQGYYRARVTSTSSSDYGTLIMPTTKTESKGIQDYIPFKLSEDEVFELTLLISEQEDLYGVNMFESMSTDDRGEVQRLVTTQGVRYDHAVRFVFEQKFNPDSHYFPPSLASSPLPAPSHPPSSRQSPMAPVNSMYIPSPPPGPVSDPMSRRNSLNHSNTLPLSPPRTESIRYPQNAQSLDSYEASRSRSVNFSHAHQPLPTPSQYSPPRQSIYSQQSSTFLNGPQHGQSSHVSLYSQTFNPYEVNNSGANAYSHPDLHGENLESSAAWAYQQQHMEMLRLQGQNRLLRTRSDIPANSNSMMPTGSRPLPRLASDGLYFQVSSSVYSTFFSA